MYRFLLFFLAVTFLAACGTPKSGPTGNNTEPPIPEVISALEELTDNNFSDKMKRGEGLRVAYFTAAWCGPCRVLGPTMDKVSSDFRGQVLMGKMDVDHHHTDAFNNVTTVPTILFFKDGEEVFRTHGIVSESYMKTVIERLR